MIGSFSHVSRGYETAEVLVFGMHSPFAGFSQLSSTTNFHQRRLHRGLLHYLETCLGENIDNKKWRLITANRFFTFLQVPKYFELIWTVYYSDRVTVVFCEFKDGVSRAVLLQLLLQANRMQHWKYLFISSSTSVAYIWFWIHCLCMIFNIQTLLQLIVCKGVTRKFYRTLTRY